MQRASLLSGRRRARPTFWTPATPLADYLAGVGRARFAWGTNDCCTFAADWVRICAGFDPMASFRGRYADEAEALDVLCAAGGLEAAWRAACADLEAVALGAGFEPGDVALVAPRPAAELLRFTGRGGTVSLERAWPALIGAIKTGIGWAMRTRSGVVVTQGDPVAAWRV